MRIQLTPPQKALHPAYRKEKISSRDINALKNALPRLLDLLADPKLNESTLRDHVQSFYEFTFTTAIYTGLRMRTDSGPWFRGE